MKLKIKRTLAAIITVVMILTAIPFGWMGHVLSIIPTVRAKSISSYKVGDIIEFGSYPQSKVTNSTTINALDKISKNWISYEYDHMESPEYMKYSDINYGGNKYRAVIFNVCRNSFQEENGYNKNKIYYFKFEPLKWQILDPSDGYIMCTIAIDAQAYQKEMYYGGAYSYYNSKDFKHFASNWETSTIRVWLNDNFYKTAFDSTETNKIKTSYIDNKSSRYEDYDSANTYDKIFFVSYYEAINRKYGEIEHFYTATDYAKCQGCRMESIYEAIGPSCSCWLRSAYSTEYASCIGSYGGNAYNMGDGPDVTSTYIGVVPACKIDLNSIGCDKHEYNSKITVQPKCTTEGVKTYTCVNCGDTYTEKIVATGHTDGEWKVTKPATLTATGIRTLYCKVCGEKIRTETIPKLNSAKIKSVSINDISIDYKSNAKLKPTIEADNGAEYTVEYASSNAKVATVDNNGNVYGAGKGKATITCTVTDSNGNSVSDTSNVTVSYNWWQWIIKIALFGWIWY